MKKKYLKTVEDLLALKDTDTKIYREPDEEYYYHQFVDGTLCRFDSDGDVKFNIAITSIDKYYILEEEYEEQQEATVKDVGKLCWCWDDDDEASNKMISVLKSIDMHREFYANNIGYYIHCRPLTKEEIKEFMEKAE